MSNIANEEIAFPVLEAALCSYPRRLHVFPRTKVHEHSFFELAFALEDGAAWDFPDLHKRVTLPKGYWILTPPKTRHAEIFTHHRDPLLGWIGFTVPAGCSLESALVNRAFRAFRCFSGPDHPQKLLDEILREQEHALLYWKQKRRLVLQRLVLTLMRDAKEDEVHPATIDRVIPHLSASLPTYLDNAAYFLAEHFARPSAVTEVAQFYRVSETHFMRLFRRRFKVSPKAFQMDARNAEVKRLLESTDNDQLSIAVQCGFHDASHLSKFFKKRNGTTPQGFRERISKSGKV